MLCRAPTSEVAHLAVPVQQYVVCSCCLPQLLRCKNVQGCGMGFEVLFLALVMGPAVDGLLVPSLLNCTACDFECCQHRVLSEGLCDGRRCMAVPWLVYKPRNYVAVAGAHASFENLFHTPCKQSSPDGWL